MSYTEEITKSLIKDYLELLGDESVVDILAEKYGKPKKSIIGKLSKEGVYVKKVYKTKQGTNPITKKEMIHKLSMKIGADVDKLQGLEKAPKLDLTYLLEVLNVEL